MKVIDKLNHNGKMKKKFKVTKDGSGVVDELATS